MTLSPKITHQSAEFFSVQGVHARTTQKIIRASATDILADPAPKKTQDRAVTKALVHACPSKLELDSRKPTNCFKVKFILGVKTIDETRAEQAIGSDHLV